MNIAAMPKSIVKAICAVQASIEAVEKTQYNKHGGYKFASTDDIYAAVTRKLGACGVMILPVEMSPVEETITKVEVFDQAGAKTGEKAVTKLRFHFGYIIATEDDTWFDHRSARTIILQHTGPQTFNAAESYCQKAYLRSMFKLPTGEMDLDAMPETDTDEPPRSNGKAAPTPRKSSAQSKRDGTSQVFNEIKEKIEKARDASQCKQVWQLYGEELGGMARRWFDMLSEEFITRMKDLGEDVDVDADGWPILNLKEAA